MKNVMMLSLVLALAVCGLASTTWAAKDRDLRAQEYSDYDRMMEKFYHPTDWIELGGDFRARYIYAPRITTLDDYPSNQSGPYYSNWQFTRWRTRLWGVFTLSENLTFNARVVNESRNWCDPDSKQAEWNCDEWFWDRFNFTWNNAFDLPLTLVFGRQDISLGHRWLVFDGTQGDGSRSIHFDAIRGTYTFEDWDATLDAIYINNEAYQRNRLKPINDRVLPIHYEDQRAFILWGSKRWNENLKTDAYYIWREDVRPVNSTSRERNFHTLGALVDGFFDDAHQWEYYAEGAVQFGRTRENYSSTEMQDFCAFGFNSKFMYHRQDEMSNCFGLSYEFLSGDDPSTTGKNEQFDPLWGTWPQWSELLIYTWSQETSIAEITNLHRLGLHWTCKPTEKLTVAANWHFLWADENTLKGSTSSALRFDDAADFRGQLYSLWFIYNYNKHWKGHLVTEYFCPGAYYTEDTDSSAAWVRLNVEYTF